MRDAFSARVADGITTLGIMGVAYATYNISSMIGSVNRQETTWAGLEVEITGAASLLFFSSFWTIYGYIWGEHARGTLTGDMRINVANPNIDLTACRPLTGSDLLAPINN